MINKNAVRATVFVADQAGINKLKDDFFDEARDFVYFRKGEWHGVRASINKARHWAQTFPDWISTAKAMYTPAPELISLVAKGIGIVARVVSKIVRKYFTKHTAKTVTRRVICSPDIGEAEIREWEYICGVGSVVTIPHEQVGQFRYVVNEKRFAIFSRLGPNNLQGIMGTNEAMIRMLRDRFDQEFIESLVKREIRRNKPKKRKS